MSGTRNHDERTAARERWGDAAEGGLGEHLASATLMAYHRGELSPEEEDRIQEHLTRCSECAQLFLALPTLSEEPAESPLSEPELAAAWKGFQEGWRERRQERLEPTPLPALAPRSVVAFPPSSPAQPAVAPRPSHAPLWQLAAALIVGVGLGLWGMKTATTSPPPLPTFKNQTAQPPVSGGERGEMLPPLTIDFTRGDKVAVVVLTPEQNPGDGPFTGRILRMTGEVQFEEEGVEPTDLGTFVLVLPRGALSKGSYRVQVVAVTGKPPSVVLDQPLQVNAAEP